MATADELKALEEASDASAQAAATLLDADLKNVMKHLERLKQLKPKTADEATFRRLMGVLQHGTRRNESAAVVRANVQKLGSGAVALFNEMAKLAGKVV